MSTAASSSTSETIAEPGLKIKVSTKEGEVFELDEKVAKMSQVIRGILEDLGEQNGGDDSVLPLTQVETRIFRKILVWLKYHAGHDKEEAPKAEEDEIIARFCEEIPEWDQKFLNVDQAVILEIMLAADYLDIKKLRGLCCKTVANILKTKTVEQIREMYGIENDFTPEEEEEIRKQTAWCEDEPPRQGSNH